MLPRLIVFDLDGTLVDSRQDLADSTNELIAGYGRAPLPDDAIVRMVGEGARVLVERALRAAGITTDLDAALARFLVIYDRRLLVHTRLYEGMREVLAALARESRLAVLTNKPTAPSRRVLEALQVDSCFTEVVGGDGPFPRKPAPDALAHLMTRYEARGSAVLVGDSAVDVRTAAAAGVPVCLVRYGFGYATLPVDLRPRVTVTIGAPGDLPAALRDIAG